MNLLPSALYGAGGWREALAAALSDGVIRGIPGGLVSGRPFFVAALLGSPALLAPAREALRRWRLKSALQHAKRAFDRAFTGRIRFELDDQPRMKAEALALLLPMISGEDADPLALQAICLDPRHGADAVRLGVKALIGDWKSDPAVRTQPCRRGLAFARASIPCILTARRTGSGARRRSPSRPSPSGPSPRAARLDPLLMPGMAGTRSASDHPARPPERYPFRL
jgi:hypothetical protein